MVRTRIRQVLAGLTLVALAGAAPDSQSDDGFLSLFNGKDLSQWKVPEGDRNEWKVVEVDGQGVIDCDVKRTPDGDMNLISNGTYGDFVLRLDWRLKEAPFKNRAIPYVLPDGTHARGIDGKDLALVLPDADSGVYLRDVKGKSQINIWCWPIGSGEVYGYRMDKRMSPEVRAGVTPKHQADKPVGEWNSFEITLKGDRLTVVLNGVTVIEHAELPGIPRTGPICLQHHGSFKDGKYLVTPSLVQFRNIRIKPLSIPDQLDNSRVQEIPKR